MITLFETLPPWERVLLQTMTFIQPERYVWDALCNGQCFMATDGSAPKDRGSFAWVLCNAAGDCLTRCSSLVLGFAISSYRAEGCGILSALQFLHHMRQMHRQPGDNPHAPYLVCDNLSLTKRVTQIMEYTTIYPNTTLEAEWDCLSQIRATAHALDTINPTIKHIKGHQDDKTPYKELPLLAQMNCNADAFANAFLRDNPEISHINIHQFPAGECVLQLTHGTITRALKQACSEARNLPPLITHLTMKNKWFHDHVFDWVDWVAHGQA